MRKTKNFPVRGKISEVNSSHKTLDWEESESTMVVGVIQVTGMSSDSNLLTLLKLYARRKIPVEEQIETPAKIKEKDDDQVSLLIVAYCMKALEPTKIHTEGGGPHAYKARLG